MPGQYRPRRSRARCTTCCRPALIAWGLRRRSCRSGQRSGGSSPASSSRRRRGSSLVSLDEALERAAESGLVIREGTGRPRPTGSATRWSRRRPTARCSRAAAESSTPASPERWRRTRRASATQAGMARPAPRRGRRGWPGGRPLAGGGPPGQGDVRDQRGHLAPDQLPRGGCATRRGSERGQARTPPRAGRGAGHARRPREPRPRTLRRRTSTTARRSRRRPRRTCAAGSRTSGTVRGRPRGTAPGSPSTSTGRATPRCCS